jgi:hypothetical protein
MNKEEEEEEEGSSKAQKKPAKNKPAQKMVAAFLYLCF